MIITRFLTISMLLASFSVAQEVAFTMVVSSKPRDVLAQAAIADAGRMDKQDAPRRELDRQRKVDDERRVQQEKARLANKARFRP